MKRIIELSENDYKALKEDGVENHIALANTVIAYSVPYEPKKELVPVCKVTFDEEQLREIVDKAKVEMLASIERPQDEWIPVSERLPEIATACIVQLSNGYITMGKYHSIRGGSWVFIDTTIQFVYPKDSVIAWQPLPEPYKEEGEEE